MVMERLHPHIIMRRGMINGVVYARFAEQVSEYLAQTLFQTSDLAVPAGAKKERVALFCGNTELCKISEDLIFTDPYMIQERNRWTSPQLDAAAASIRADAALKRAVSALKLKFLTESQALLHGDLHTGSIMITDTDTRVIDPEFAFYGPMAFDIGKLTGNLLLSFFSQTGHEVEAGQREAYRHWILETVEQIWARFAQRYLELWNGPRAGDAYPPSLFEGQVGAESLGRAQQAFMGHLLRDGLGFAGAAMIRRTLGLAHNIDFEQIRDPDRRARCERHNLQLARELILGAGEIGSIADVTARARELESQGRS
jgi:5-methylthioribose kinase